MLSKTHNIFLPLEPVTVASMHTHTSTRVEEALASMHVLSGPNLIRSNANKDLD